MWKIETLTLEQVNTRSSRSGMWKIETLTLEQVITRSSRSDMWKIETLTLEQVKYKKFKKWYVENRIIHELLYPINFYHSSSRICWPLIDVLSNVIVHISNIKLLHWMQAVSCDT